MREKVCKSQAGRGHGNDAATYRQNYYAHNDKSLIAGIKMLLEKSVYVRGAWLIPKGMGGNSGTMSDAHLHTGNIVQTHDMRKAAS